MNEPTMPCERCSTPVLLASATGTALKDQSGGRFWLEICPNCLAILERPADLKVERWRVLKEPSENLEECITDTESRLKAARAAHDEALGNEEDASSIGDEITRLERQVLVIRAHANAVSE